MKKEMGLGEGELQKGMGELRDRGNCWDKCRKVKEN
jgi:alpha/beta superfamily hydrolase